VKSIGISVGTLCGNEMEKSYAKVQPPETRVNEVYLVSQLLLMALLLGFKFTSHREDVHYELNH
jgi:hypothetical protein